MAGSDEAAGQSSSTPLYFGDIEADGVYGMSPTPPVLSNRRRGTSALLHSPDQEVPNPPGPATLDEVLDWAPQYIRHIAALSPATYHRLVQKLVRQPGEEVLQIWTDYSGLGGSELAVLEILAGLRSLGIDAQIMLYRAREIRADCRAVLLAKTGIAGPKHVFGDILSGLSQTTRQQLQACSKKVERYLDAHALDLQFPQHNQKAGLKFCRLLETAMQGVVFKSDRRQYCYRCCRQCPVSFENMSNHGIQRSMAIAGVTCLDHSSFGKRKALTGPSMVCYMVWAFQMMADQPELIIIECVVLFALRSLNAFHQLYTVATLDFSPTDLGIPSRRPRKYMLLRHRSKTTDHEDLEVEFWRLFSRSLVCNADIYCVAEQRESQRELQERAKGPLSLTPVWEDVLTEGTRSRLREWLKVADAQGCTSGFVNISQNPAYLRSPIRTCAPTLLRGSLLWSLAHKRVPY